MTFLIGLIVLFCGAVIAKEFAYLPAQVRRFSTMVHNHRTLARIISFLIVLVVKCLADSTVVSVYKTTTGLGCIPLSGISDHCSLTFVQFIRSTILSGSVNYYALSCCLSGDLTKWSVQWERALHVVQWELLSNMIYMLSGKSGGWLAENDKSSTIRGDDNNKPPKSFSICKQTSYTIACLILIAIPFSVSPPVPTVYYPEWDELPKWDNSYQRI